MVSVKKLNAKNLNSVHHQYLQTLQQSHCAKLSLNQRGYNIGFDNLDLGLTRWNRGNDFDCHIGSSTRKDSGYSLPFATESLDYVVVNLAILQTPDNHSSSTNDWRAIDESQSFDEARQQFIIEIQRCLKDGGVLVWLSLKPQTRWAQHLTQLLAQHCCNNSTSQTLIQHHTQSKQSPQPTLNSKTLTVDLPSITTLIQQIEYAGLTIENETHFLHSPYLNSALLTKLSQTTWLQYYELYSHTLWTRLASILPESLRPSLLRLSGSAYLLVSSKSESPLTPALELEMALQ